MWHSCVRVTVADHLRGKPRAVVDLYREVARAVRAAGPGVRPVCSKTRIGWMVRARFAGVSFRRGHLVLGFWLKRELRSPRLKHRHLGGDDHLYELPIRSPEDLDAEVSAWLAEAYLVGAQRTAARARPAR